MKGTKILATILLFVVLYALFALTLMLAWNFTFRDLMNAQPMPYTIALVLTAFAWLAKITLLV